MSLHEAIGSSLSSNITVFEAQLPLTQDVVVLRTSTQYRVVVNGLTTSEAPLPLPISVSPQPSSYHTYSSPGLNDPTAVIVTGVPPQGGIPETVILDGDCTGKGLTVTVLISVN